MVYRSGNRPAARESRAHATASYIGKGIVGSGGVSVLTFNMKLSNTANFRAAFRSGVTTPVALVGDSQFRGITASLPTNAAFPNGMARQTAARFNSKGIVAGFDNLFGVGDGTSNSGSLATLKSRDYRFDFGGGATVGSQAGGGAGFSLPSAGAFISISSLFTATKFDLWDRNAGTGSGFTYSVDGGAPVTVSQTGAFAMRKTTIDLVTPGLHTVRVEWAAGNPTVYGGSFYDDRRSEIRLHDFSIAGGDSLRLGDNTGSPSAGRPQMYIQTGSKLALVEGGVTNDWRGNVSVATFKTNLTNLVTMLQAANIDVVLWTPPFDGSGVGSAANQEAYITAMYEVATVRDCGLIDIRKRWLSDENQVAQGFANLNDPHPLLKGYQDAGYVAAEILSQWL